MPSKHPKFPPEFEDMLRLFNRMKEDSVRVAVEKLEEERGKAERIGKEYANALAAHNALWRREIREFLILAFRLIKDAVLFGIFWLILKFVHLLEEFLPIQGRAATTLATFHEYLLVVMYGTLAVFVIWDLIESRVRRSVK